MTQTMFSNQNETKLYISSRKIPGKITNIWKLINTLLNNQYDKRNNTGCGKYFKSNEHTKYQVLWLQLKQ